MHIADGWFQLDKSLVSEDIIEGIKKELTIPNYEYYQAQKLGFKYEGFKDEYLWEEDENHLLLPRQVGIDLAFSNVNDCRIFQKRDRILRSTFKERIKGQEKIVRKAIGSLREKNYATIIAPCGHGKTCMAIEISNRLRLPTLVIVHKDFLMNQWRENIFGTEEKIGILPDAKVGFVQGDTCDFEEKDIVIAMMQSLVSSKRRYPEELYKWPSLVITDEAHRLGAKRWRYSIVQFPAKYRLLLTAEPERIDGREVVFEYHVGKDRIIMEHTGLLPRIEKVMTDFWSPVHTYTNHWNGKINIGKLITLIAKDEPRNRNILNILNGALRAGRQILVLSDRKYQLDFFRKNVENSGMYVGGMSDRQLKQSAERSVILGTYAKAQEGLDIPSLSVVILATPKVKIQQSVGRILRELKGKAEPVVVDVIDKNIGICVGMSKARHKVYMNLGYV